LACGSRAATRGAYRLFANSAVSPTAILAAHVAQTVVRCRRHARVFVVHDTTDLDFTGHAPASGVGPLSATTHRGLLVHSALALDPTGVPLGLLAQSRWARPLPKARDRKGRPLADKESQKWPESLKAADRAFDPPPDPQLVHLADAEADVYDLLALVVAAGRDAVIRVAQNRCIAQEERLVLRAVAAAPVLDIQPLTLARTPKRAARTTRVALKIVPVTLQPPSHRSAEGLPALALTVVAVEEVDPPPDVEPVCWRLFTTAPTTTVAEGWDRVSWYQRRWGIEQYHFVLKSGCRIEERRAETRATLDRAVVVDAIVAWRLLYLTRLARQQPEAPADELLSREDWRLLHAATASGPPPPEPPTIRQVMRAIATLGGFLGRPGDGEPGVKTIWRGLTRFEALREGARLARSLLPDVGNG
jgi:hypothetical protein